MRNTKRRTDLKSYNNKTMFKEGDSRLKMKLKMSTKCRYRYRRTRRLPSSCSERKKNNLRDHCCYTIILISRAREYRFRIGNKINLVDVKLLRQQLLQFKFVKEPEKKKLE